MKYFIKVYFLISLFTMSYIKSEAQEIFLDIRIYSIVNIQEVKVKIFSGKYELRTKEEKNIDLYRNSVIKLKAKDSIVQIFQNNQLLTSSPIVTIQGVGFLNTFEIEPTKPSLVKRIYDDNLVVKAIGNNLLIINNVELERYVAGVVESEGGGSSKDIDFFVVQAISCRTYALANVRKHRDEGFHLCDDVHCQVYRGRCKNSMIMMATYQTAGNVLVDKNGKMISAAFHSNSGGQTMNSEDVWTSATSYLKSVIDTFSLKGRNAKWEMKMPTIEWLNFLKTTYNYPIENPEMKEKAINFKQPTRLVYFPGNIPLEDIRRDLKLKSTFFCVVNKGDKILLDGRGFGHGVGLSQEGAIRMIQLGYSHEDVINFYYQNVRIVNFDELDYFFINFNL